MKRVPFSVVVLGVLCAALPDCKCTCTDSGAAPAPRLADHQSLRPLAIDPQWRKCVAGDVCILAPADCCGCHNGGTDVAVNAKSAGAAGEARVSACGAPVCAQMVGNDPSCRGAAQCVDGMCQIVGPPQPVFKPVKVEPLGQPLPPNVEGLERVRPRDPSLQDPTQAPVGQPPR